MINGINGLYSWRNVMSPRPEVTQGDIQQAEFSVDLVQVWRGGGSYEYRNADEFFRRTFLTEGMKRFLAEALRRVAGYGGDPVIQVKTAFGGGKTHSMLAMCHMLRAGENALRLEGMREVLRLAGCERVPAVRMAVVGGTSDNPLEFAEVNGVKARSLWGYIAAQLGRYESVRRNDEQGIAPGSESFRRIFDDGEPCVVLMDELAAYGRKLYEGDKYRGSFGNFHTFVQELTEAAKHSSRSLVVATMPDSKLEAGDKYGVEVLKILEHVFGRVESVWKPVEPREGFEVVRRRLFAECVNDSARERTAEVFSRMYQENPLDFPAQTHDGSYRERLLKCYPIHPEIFDRLYGEWSALENFQRTRGVLRLMAKVIHDLWVSNDLSPLIMPCSINFGSGVVREEIIKYLPESNAWNSIIDVDIDGADSISRRLDNRGRYGEFQATRRVARTILLGSAPSVGAQSVRGIEKPNILLGTVQPGENISVFNDALGTLRDSLSYLYASETGYRFWFDTRPTLRKMVENRAVGFSVEAVDELIRMKAQNQNRAAVFEGVHVFAKADGVRSEGVRDTQEMKLVLLRPEEGEAEALRIVQTHEGTDRTNKNRLVFLCADSDKVEELRKKARMFLAWQAVRNEKGSLNLTGAQVSEVNASIARYDGEIDEGICEAWSVSLVPKSEKGAHVDSVKFERVKVSGTAGSVSERAGRTLMEKHEIVERWAAEHMSLELERLIWDKNEDIQAASLWEAVCRYCYMPKLTGRDVLYAGISDGVKAGYFALADGKDDGKYTHLRIGEPVSVNDSDFVVRKDIAEEQLAAEKSTASETETAANDNNNAGIISTHGHTPKTQTQTLNRKFYMTAHLERKNNPQDFIKTIFRDIIDNLHDVPGAQVEIVLNVQMKNSDGVPDDIYDAVVYNCKHFGITDCEFYE